MEWCQGYTLFVLTRFLRGKTERHYYEHILNFSQEESTINTGNSFFINDWARLTVNGLLPTIKMPGFPSNERLSLFAIGLIVKPCATTVKKTNPNVNVVNNLASS